MWHLRERQMKTTRKTKKPTFDTLSAAIADRIKRLDLTPYAVGKRSGVNASMIQRFLHGERTLTLKTAARLCEALELELLPRTGSTLAIELMRQRHGE
jgi:transcriptional regulator with XRE-family HTH domain